MASTVRDILAEKGPQVYGVGPDDSVYQALERLAEFEVGALVVLDGPRVLGMVGEREYARCVILLGRTSRATTVREVMRAPVATVDAGATAYLCMALMTELRVRHLPVVEHGHLVGLVSIGDVMKAIIDEREFELEELHAYVAGAR
jgi:CBS domain-containing protein